MNRRKAKMQYPDSNLFKASIDLTGIKKSIKFKSTEEFRQEAYEMYVSGKSFREIADTLKVRRSTAKNMIRNYKPFSSGKE